MRRVRGHQAFQGTSLQRDSLIVSDLPAMFSRRKNSLL